MARLLLILSIFLSLSACSGDTKTANATSVKDSVVSVQNTLTLSLPAFMQHQALDITVYNQLAGTFDSTHSIAPEDKSIALPLNTERLYRVTVNPDNDYIDIKCPLFDGCYDERNDAQVTYNAPINTRLSLSALVYVDTDQDIEISPISDLTLKLFDATYRADEPKMSLLQARSTMANTLGVISYHQLAQPEQGTDYRNYHLQKAINIAALFEGNSIKANATSHLKTIARRVIQTVNGQQNRLDEFNRFIFDDAADYLQQYAQHVNSAADVNATQQVTLAKLRAFVLSKSVYPNKGFIASPYLGESKLETTKHFLDDYRSLLYTFVDDSNEYQQVVSATTLAYELIDHVTSNLLDDSFDLFNRVLDQVPLNSNTGQYHVDDLIIDYDDDALTWQINGDHKGKTVALNVSFENITVDSFAGNLFSFAVNGKIASSNAAILLNDAEIELYQTPPDDPFGGEGDGTGSINIISKVTATQGSDAYTGIFKAQLTTHKQPGKTTLVQNLEYAQVYGTLAGPAQDHQLALALVHPDINHETSSKLMPNSLLALVNYSSPIKGLGEPVLGIYMPFADVDQGFDVNNLQAIVYFEGRLSQFTFNGTTSKFDYTGRNQDGVEWQLTYRKKEADGEVNYLQEQMGHPRVLKDLAGLMFSDGHFVSIF
jgi:hypothetical protein